MKKLTYMFIMILAITASSCSKNNDATPSSSTSIDAQKSIVASSSWRVTYFTERGVDQTSSLSSFDFQFNTDGTLAVTGPGGTYNGTWAVMMENHSKPDDSGNHSGTEDHKMVIQIGGIPALEEISEDWHIVSITSSEMRFIDDNPLSAKEIHFSK
jgi:hypothetical protein